MKRIGRTDNSSRLFANITLYTLPSLAMAVFFMLVNELLLFTVCIAFPIYLYSSQTKKIDRELKRIDEKIIEDIPEFTSYITSSLKIDKNIQTHIKNYLPATNKELRAELEKLLADIKTGNVDEALVKFDMRINFTHLSNYIAAVRAYLSGEEQSQILDTMAEDMELYEYELAKKNATLLPSKINKASFAVAISMFVTLLTIMTVAIVNNLSAF